MNMQLYATLLLNSGVSLPIIATQVVHGYFFENLSITRVRSERCLSYQAGPINFELTHVVQSQR